MFHQKRVATCSEVWHLEHAVLVVLENKWKRTLLQKNKAEGGIGRVVEKTSYCVSSW